MIDVRLAAELFAALPSGHPAGAGGRRGPAAFRGAGGGAGRRHRVRRRVPIVRLTEIFRQAAESLIVTNAHRIHEGLLPELGTAPAGGRPPTSAISSFWRRTTPPGRRRWCATWSRTRLPRRYDLSPHDMQVLSPMHRGELGAGNLNSCCRRR